MRMKKITRILACFILTGIFWTLPAAAETAAPVLTVYYFHRPPYYIKQGDRAPGGFLVDVTRIVLDQAGISYQLIELPPKRILQKIEQNEYCCSIGWFKNPEREKFALFSDIIYQNRPTVIVVRQGAASGFSEKPALKQLMESHLVLGVIEGFSYGPKIDAAISLFKPKIYGISGDSENLLKMICNQHLDYAFMAPEEAAYIVGKDSLLKPVLQIIEIDEEPMGNERYLMFSKMAGSEIVDRVNAAIQIVKSSDRYAETVSFMDRQKQ